MLKTLLREPLVRFAALCILPVEWDAGWMLVAGPISEGSNKKINSTGWIYGYGYGFTTALNWPRFRLDSWRKLPTLNAIAQPG